jgi:hypothetical protein
MPAALAPRRNDAPAPGGAAAKRTNIAAARAAIERVGLMVARSADEEDELVLLIGQWLRAVAAGERPGNLLTYLAEIENKRGVSAQLKDEIARRNEALRRAASLYWGDLEIGEQSQLLARALKSYFERTWRRKRGETENPEPPETLDACLWEALRARARAICKAQIRRVLNIRSI